MRRKKSVFQISNLLNLFVMFIKAMYLILRHLKNILLTLCYLLTLFQNLTYKITYKTFTVYTYLM